MKHTPLHDEHVAAGGRMVEFGGYSMPVQYRSIVEEHCAVRNAVGVFDVSHMGEVTISGPRAVECLSTLMTNDARALSVGRAQYSLIPNERGGVVDDVIVYRLEHDGFLVCVNAANTAKDLEWLRSRAPSTGCTVRDVSEEYALLAVQGPRSAVVVEALARGASGLPRFAFLRAEVAGQAAIVARTGYTGEDGFEIFVDASAARPLWCTLIERGCVPAGLGARDTLRLEAALPLYGHEIDETISPYEARLGWAVKLDRPDMVGYDALRANKETAERRRTVGLFVEGGIGRQGCAVLASGSRIGAITSGSHSPTLGRAVALALLDREPGDAALAVDVRGKLRNARVTALPFYVRQPHEGAGH
jgi:aminomethyltransferase